MSQNSTRQAAMVGLFVSAGFVIFVASLLAVGNLTDGLRHRTEVTASFKSVDGLKPGDAVWFAGVPVGMVKGVQLTPGGGVGVALAIDDNVAMHVPRDVQAKLSSDGLIGNRIVVLEKGTSAKPIEDGQTVPVGPSLSAEQLMEEVQQTNTQLQTVATNLLVVTERIASGEGTVGRLLADDGLYDGVTVAVQDLQGAMRQADVMAKNGAAFSQKLNTEGNLLNDLVTDQTSYKSMTASVESIEQTAASLKVSATDPTTPMGVLLHDQPAGGDLAETLENLNTSSELLAEDLEALQHNFLLRGFFKKKEKQEKKHARNAGDTP